ncbi:MAG: WG repeat-containing protein [Aureispira sp.]|nr:WG repeat-containing protein [Aureispira sp.]
MRKIYLAILTIFMFFIIACDESTTSSNGTDNTVENTDTTEATPKPDVPVAVGALVVFEDESDQKFGYKDEKGTLILEPKYAMAMDFENGIAPVVDDEGWAYINEKGEVLLRPFVFDNGPDYFEGGLARFKENNKIGFMDDHGKKVIPANFDFAWPFKTETTSACNGCKEEFADETGEHKVIRGGKWGLIDKTGNWVIPCEYDEIKGFGEEETGEVRTGEEWLKFDNKGTRL